MQPAPPDKVLQNLDPYPGFFNVKTDFHGAEQGEFVRVLRM
jgi:hypothetical protein